MSTTYEMVFYGPLSSADTKDNKLRKEHCEYGTVRDEKLVLAPFCKEIPTTKEAKESTFEVSVSPFEATFNKLGSRRELPLLLAVKEHDDMLDSSKLKDSIKSDMKALRECDEAEAKFAVKERNSGSLTSSEEEARKRNLKKRAAAKELIDENVEKLFLYYKCFVEIRSAKFSMLVQSYCQKVATFEKEQLIVYREAFHLGPAGERLTTRFPEKDAEENEDTTHGTGWYFVHAYRFELCTVTGMRGKTLETFEYCRREHLRQEFPLYGYAEAQYDYLSNHIKIPKGVDVRTMSDMFENFSLIMYLLPSIRQHPEYQLHNALTHITPRNVPFSEGEKCLMVLHSMPKAVQLEWTKDHPKKPIPVDLTSLIIELQPILDKYREEFDSKSQ